MDTFDVLVAARAEVEKGWCRCPDNLDGIGQDSNGKVCAIGAIVRVASFEGGRPREVLETALEGDLCIAMWNDLPSTAKADVLALFDRAIAAEAVAATPDPAHVHALA